MIADSYFCVSGAADKRYSLSTGMSNYEFKPSGKKGRNKYIGSWSETASRKIELPFTVESLKQILVWGKSFESIYSHQDLAHWCGRFHMATFDIDSDQKMDIACGIAADVEAQWDMYLANTYKLEQLQQLDFGAVELPKEWFDDWFEQIENA